MEFKINFSLYANEQVVRNDIVRYMKTARNNLGLSFPAIKTICENNYLRNCSTLIWLMETKGGNPVMDTFWIACAIYRVRMAVIDGTWADKREEIVIAPFMENDYSVIRKKIGALFFEKRMSMKKSLSKVVSEVGGISVGTISDIEQGKTRLTIKNFLKLMKYYGFMMDLRQNINQ